MTEKKVTTKNKSNETLVGIETRPDETQDKYPTVILVHGFGVTKSEDGMFDTLAKYLADAGILSYRFDFSGLGESEGDYTGTSLTKLRDDLNSILELVRTTSYVDVKKIGIHAQSFGTCATIVLVPDVASIVLTGSATHMAEILAKHFGAGYHPEGISERFSESTNRLIKIGPQFWTDLVSYDLLRSMKKNHCPILFIQGEKDEICSIPEMEELYDAANDPKEKMILEGADHGLEPGREKMYKMSIDWFRKYLA